FFHDKSHEGIRKRVELETVRNKVISTSVDLPLSRQCKRALAYGAEEAQRLKHKLISTEHLLLGLLREEGSLASRILQECGVERSAIVDGIDAKAVATGGTVPSSKPKLITSRMTAESRNTLVNARLYAHEGKAALIESWHLLMALLSCEELVRRT